MIQGFIHGSIAAGILCVLVEMVVKAIDTERPVVIIPTIILAGGILGSIAMWMTT